MGVARVGVGVVMAGVGVVTWAGAGVAFGGGVGVVTAGVGVTRDEMGVASEVLAAGGGASSILTKVLGNQPTFPWYSPDHHFSLCCNTRIVSPRTSVKWLSFDPFQANFTVACTDCGAVGEGGKGGSVESAR